MIQYVTGTLGHGKSLYAARRIGNALLSGRCVMTNIELLPGWEHTILQRSAYYRFAGKKARQKQRDELWTRYRYEEDFVTMVRAKMFGKGEGRGLRVFDEAHNKLNNRDWKGELQNQTLRRMSLGRKRGWNDLIVSQHAKNTDVAIRRIADSEVRMIDWQKVLKLPVIHAQLLPFHMFLAQTFPIEESAVPGVARLGRRQSSELFFLGWWSRIYDTYADYDFDDDLDGEFIDGVWVPIPPVMLPRPLSELHALRTSAEMHSVAQGSQNGRSATLHPIVEDAYGGNGPTPTELGAISPASTPTTPHSGGFTNSRPNDDIVTPNGDQL